MIPKQGNSFLTTPGIKNTGLSYLAAALVLFSLNAHSQNQPKNPKFNLDVSSAYYTENFNWSIAGNINDRYVNILSELRWRKIKGVQLNINGEYDFWKGLFAKGNLSKAFITSGKVSDTDFGKDNRQDTLFHDTFNSDQGNITSWATGVGYKIPIVKKYSVAPFVGYGINTQNLFVLRDYGNVTGNLKSTYDTKWKGLTMGLSFIIPVHERIKITAQSTYRQLNYSAKANWNLIEDFEHPVSFRHKAKGYGVQNSIGVQYLFNRNIAVSLNGQIGHWITGKGTDTLYRTNGEVNVTQLNRVHRNSATLGAGIQISF
jgi:hypothetical protein